MDIYNAVKKKMISEVYSNMQEALKFAKGKIEEKTPEDTGELVDNYEIINPVFKDNKIIGKIVNNTDYAFYVENGVQDRIFKYNKPKGNIFRVGVGAKMMKKTSIEDFGDIKEIIGDININVTEKGIK